MIGEKLMDNFKNAMHKEGYKVTPQRIAVLKEIVKNKGHRESEEIYLAIKSCNTHVSRATVYRALDILVQNNNLESAKELYLKAIEFSDDPGPIMRKLLFVYIDMGDNQKAIDYSNELLDKYPNDADLYYNVGVLYQRLTLELFDPARGLFLETTPESEPATIKGVYDSFKTTRQYAYNSKDYFLQASDLELDGNLSAHEAVSEMRKLMDQIDEIFIPSIRQTAHSAGIELD